MTAPIQTKNIPFPPAPRPPAYGQPWHEWARDRLGLPLPAGSMPIAPGDVIDCVAQPVAVRGGIAQPRDFRVERVAFARGFEIELVEVDGYHAYTGKAYDVVHDFAHADAPALRVIDLVPRVLRADPSAWVHVRARNCNPVAARFHAIAFGTWLDPVQLGAAALPKPTNKGER